MRVLSSGTEERAEPGGHPSLLHLEEMACSFLPGSRVPPQQQGSMIYMGASEAHYLGDMSKSLSPTKPTSLLCSHLLLGTALDLKVSAAARFDVEDDQV